MRALVPLAEGCEEIELTALVDTFRRAGWEVVVAALNQDPVTASRGVLIGADVLLGELDPSDFDLIALAGGLGGTNQLKQDHRILSIIQGFMSEGKPIAAICAAPLVLKEAGILEGRRLTSHPSVADQFPGAVYLQDRVVADGNLFTSRGPGTAIEFALFLVEALDDPFKAAEIAAAMVVPPA